MSDIEFFNNDPDSFHDSKLTLHDCIADKISYNNNFLSFSFPDGFWIFPDHEVNNLDKFVRTDLSQVDFYINNNDSSFDDVYVEVFSKNIFKKTIVEKWSLDELIKAVNSGDYQLEFVYQYRTYFEQMWYCTFRYKGKWMHNECYLHIPSAEATYRWNNLREECVW